MKNLYLLTEEPKIMKNLNLLTLKTKIMKNLFLILVGVLTLTSCSEDGNSNLYVNDGTIGAERFTVATYNANYDGKVNEMNGILYNAYVMPEYLPTTTVDVTVNYKSGSGKLFYNNNELLNGEKTNIDNLFKKILDGNGQWTGAYETLFTIYYTSDVASDLNVELVFENNLGTKYSIPLNLTLQ